VRRAVLLAATAACAACALVYELALVAFGAALVGSSVVQTSLVVSLFVFALGIGALLAKALLARPLRAFVAVEAGVAVCGGASVLACYLAFAYAGVNTPAVLLASLVVGALAGAELPLLMALLQRVRAQDAARAVADLTAADYVGALLGGLAFPFLLLPLLGEVRGALAAGLVNLACAAVLVVALAPRRRHLAGLGGLALAALVLGAVLVRAGDVVVTARQQLFEDPIVLQQRSAFQELVLTRGEGDDLRLFLDGDLQFSSRDEHRYHEALVHPAMAAGPHARVLVLGGGDGLAVREVLRHRGVREVVLVDLDPAVTRLARTELRAMNDGALEDPRVRVVHADAFSFVRDRARGFDVVVADLPDPDAIELAKLYSVELYGLLRARALRPGGRLVVQAGSPWFAPEQFWGIGASLREAGLRARPYHVDVPSFGDWGFHLAAAGAAPPLRAPRGLPLRFLSPEVLRAAAVFPPDSGPREAAPTTLDDPAVLEQARRAWLGY
jgi:spermidine synthase